MVADSAFVTSMFRSPLAALLAVLSLVLLLVAMFSRALGLGENESFVFYRLFAVNRAQVAVAAAVLAFASSVAFVGGRAKDTLSRATHLIALFFVLGSVLLVATIFAGSIGLGLKAEFIFYRVLGIDRSELAVGAVAAIILSVIALIVIRARNQLIASWRWLLVFARQLVHALAACVDWLLTKQRLVLQVIANGLACIGSRFKAGLVRHVARLRAYRLHRLDIVALLIIVAYGALCASTIFQAYRTYEEAWAFETDGPFYLINLDRLVHGEIGEISKLAGFFPVIVAYLFSLPLLLIEKITGDGNHVDSLFVGFRLSQTCFAMLSAALVYRITAVLSSRGLGIVVLVSFVSTVEILLWTARIHPDIQQLAMVLAGTYCLVRYCQTLQSRYFFVSAIFAGLATASKLYGLFLLPSAIVAVLAVELSGAHEKGRLSRIGMLSGAYLAIHTAAAAVMSVPHFFHASHNLKRLSAFSAGGNLLSFENAFSLDLWARKVALLFDDRFLGEGICIAFLIVVIHAIARSAQCRRIHSIHILVAFILSFFFIFLTFWGDVFNMKSGHRYLLPASSLVLIVIAVGLHEIGQRLRPWWRALPIAGAVAILVVGVPISLPLRAKTVSDEVVSLWTREETGQFQIKQWIEDHLPAGSRILTQAYMNIQLPGHIPGSLYDAGVKWRGTKDIRAYFDPWNHVYLSPKAVAKINPDFIFAVDPSDVWVILNTFSNYQLVTSVGESGIVYVLQRTDLPPLLLSQSVGPVD